MAGPSPLLAFVAAVVVLVLVPGPNTMVILAYSLGGRRAVGLATVAGVETGTIVHTLAAALGLSALLAASDVAFAAVRLLGAVYLLVLGARCWRETPELSLAGPSSLGPALAYRRALVTNVLNPKVALFFLGFLPQFADPARGHLVLQFLSLGAIVSLVGLVFGSTLALAATAVTGWLRGHPGFLRWQGRLMGTVFIGLAVRLALSRRR